jgi:hypothetical protein
LIEETKEALIVSAPWKWLISRISSTLLLSWPEKAFDDVVSKFLVSRTDRNSIKTNKLSCRVHWNPSDFLYEHSELGEKTLLRNALVATGWGDMVQMTTCGDYVEQTWSLYGLAVLAVVEEAVTSGLKGGTCKSLPTIFSVSSGCSFLLIVQRSA